MRFADGERQGGDEAAPLERGEAVRMRAVRRQQRAARRRDAAAIRAMPLPDACCAAARDALCALMVLRAITPLITPPLPLRHAASQLMADIFDTPPFSLITPLSLPLAAIASHAAAAPCFDASLDTDFR